MLLHVNDTLFSCRKFFHDHSSICMNCKSKNFLHYRNAMETLQRAIASFGFKTHFILYSFCKGLSDNKMFMYKQRIKRLTIPPKEIFELTLTLHIRKTFIFLFHFWSCFKLKSAETHRARWAQKQNNSQKMVTTFVTKRAMMIIFFGG